MEPDLDLGEMLKETLKRLDDPREAFRQAIVQWRFIAQGRSPHSWFWSAHSLITAADLTYGQFQRSIPYLAGIHGRDATPTPEALWATVTDAELGPVSLMLLGFAIENVCKGLLIQRTPHLVGDAALKRELRSHNLPHLRAACGRPANASQMTTLSFLSAYVQWAGRYPIPTRPLDAKSVGDRYGFFLSSRIPAQQLWADTRPLYTELIDATGFRTLPRDSPATSTP